MEIIMVGPRIVRTHNILWKKILSCQSTRVKILRKICLCRVPKVPVYTGERFENMNIFYLVFLSGLLEEGKEEKA